MVISNVNLVIIIVTKVTVVITMSAVPFNVDTILNVNLVIIIVTKVTVVITMSAVPFNVDTILPTKKHGCYC
jgi:hypothetical protein